jgi:hypothetical protein
VLFASDFCRSLYFICFGLLTLDFTIESLTAEREQVRKIHIMSFRRLGILLLQNSIKTIINPFTTCSNFGSFVGLFAHCKISPGKSVRSVEVRYLV